jgi:hypothetical protein
MARWASVSAAQWALTTLVEKLCKAMRHHGFVR